MNDFFIVFQEIFKQDFMIKALITGIFIAISCSLLGVFLVLKNMSLIGDGLAHVSFAAIAIQSIKNRLLWRQECGNFSTAWRTYLPGNFGGRINILSKLFRNIISESGAAQADLLHASLPWGKRALLLKTKAA